MHDERTPCSGRDLSAHAPAAGGVHFCGSGGTVSSTTGTAAPYNAPYASGANRLRALDRDNNGFIERDEWDGSPQMFDRLDRNRDGRLSRAEVNGANGGQNF